MRYLKVTSLCFATHLAFNAPEGGIRYALLMMNYTGGRVIRIKLKVCLDSGIERGCG